MIDREMRQAAFSEAMRTARTKPQRDAAIAAFLGQRQAGSRDVRFTSWLRSYGHEIRAMGEGTNSAGGYLVPPGWNGDVIHQLREYDALLKAFELWQSESGQEVVRPVYSYFTAGSQPTENAGITDGPYPVLAQQTWGQTLPYAGTYTPSNQMVQDAPNLDEIVQNGLGESIGRAIAPVAQAALYSTINTVGAADGDKGGFLALGTATAVNFATGATTELAANTISFDTAAQLVGLLNEAYLPTASWYMNKHQWSGLLRQVSSTDKKAQIDPSTGRLSLYNLPVVLTSQTTAAAASTTSGPVLGDLKAAMTLRIAGDFFYLLRSTERFAEYLETYYRAAVRADVQARDARAVVGVKYAAS